MQNTELKKSKPHSLIGIVEYMPNSVVSKTIVHKTTGNICVYAFYAGEIIEEKISPFDTFIQIIDGKAEIFIEQDSTPLNTGEAIIIPAHTSHFIKANVMFKMISTIIKSGYEGSII